MFELVKPKLILIWDGIISIFFAVVVAELFCEIKDNDWSFKKVVEGF